MGIEPRSQDYKSDALSDRPLGFLYHFYLKQSQASCITMHDWYCQIELIESNWAYWVNLTKEGRIKG